MNFLKPFSYLNDLILAWKNTGQLQIDEINLVGGRWTGKTASAMLFCWKMIMLYPESFFSIFVVRKKKLKVPEAFRQFQSWNFGIPIWQASLKNAKISGENFLCQFVGFSQWTQENPNLGIYRDPRTKLNIVFIDEAGEISNLEKIDVLGAIPPTAPTLLIRASNPWFPSSDFFVEVEKNCPFDLKKMKSDGEIFLQKDMKIWHWTCPMLFANEENSHISPEIWKMIRSARKHNPDEADLIQYGKPLVRHGGVYPAAQKPLKMIEKNAQYYFFENEPEKWHRLSEIFFAQEENGLAGKFLGGLDFGKNVAPTAMTISYTDLKKNHLIVFAAEKIDTGKFKTMAQQKPLILNFFQHWKEKFGREKIFVTTDDSDREFVNFLNQNSAKIFFSTVANKNFSAGIERRIQCLNRLFSSQKIFFYVKNTNNLIQEIRSSIWVKRGKKTVRNDYKDDLLNALEYSIINYLSELGM